MGSLSTVLSTLSLDEGFLYQACTFHLIGDLDYVFVVRIQKLKKKKMMRTKIDSYACYTSIHLHTRSELIPSGTQNPFTQRTPHSKGNGRWRSLTHCKRLHHQPCSTNQLMWLCLVVWFTENHRKIYRAWIYVISSGGTRTCKPRITYTQAGDSWCLLGLIHCEAENVVN